MTVSVVVGRIGRAHGIRGELAVDVRTDEPERRLAPGSSVVASGGRTLTIAATRQQGSKLVVRFAEVPDRNDAETLHGQVLESVVDEADVPDDDAYYDRQLVGLAVRVGSADGPAIGAVVRVDHLPSQDLLVVDVDGAEVLVPFVTALVPEVDLDAGHLVVVDRPGLLDPGAAEVVET
ncbi:ribosome maturation factor RimM [Aeromicrobium sp. Leaf350]|uniref:ribosome maturation factor RimM n=1 Tax=Aeromicrobium sp. Leaf350 TaxID=2876565 RepID=UPI001E5D8987|nr:ribosome maturation factor RimM [Aeromicrobium sp. Leaf350]